MLLLDRFDGFTQGRCTLNTEFYCDVFNEFNPSLYKAALAKTLELAICKAVLKAKEAIDES